ncbi:MAG: hypothetical protein K8R18_07990 [Parvibaculum sp.]|uniref:hypothetical protein n=1 Tax=Parvibaculum sp. TaxID=2024848 RepID=UPI0025E6C93C|nr:hypothetical protein [Parvibaculum sp.]MCE9649549.1 hypothetical protein [Parvibaculum sp.]
MQQIRKKAGSRSFGQVFRLPAAIAALSIAGLLSALIGDGALNAASWLALGSPVALMIWFGLRR